MNDNVIHDVPRLGLGETIKDAMIKITGGNPGALMVCVQLINHDNSRDPRGGVGGCSSIILLDDLGIHDDKIWMFYKGVCGEDLSIMMAVMRGYLLGIVGCTRESILHAINNYGEGLDVDKIVDEVRSRSQNDKEYIEWD